MAGGVRDDGSDVPDVLPKSKSKINVRSWSGRIVYESELFFVPSVNVSNLSSQRKTFFFAAGP